ncbi:MAG: mannose-1-phosphate guanylyltransferase [Bacteroidales bacterium]|nr:mannose-1-phosphate guanylyltransferase [Bacteroidales bacterium]
MAERYCIIMAGGIGSRFWPLSKNNYPKQFLDIFGTGKSFIRTTFERFLPLVPAENFLVVTNAAYKATVLEHLPELREDQVLCEPMRRNTAPCIAYATYHIKARCPEASIVVTPSDALVTNETEFHRIIAMGCDFVAQPEHRDALMTIGIKPSRPETGYGYIELPAGSSLESRVVEINGFKEKPDLERAKAFVEAGHYLWNAGIFIWSLDGIMQALRTFLPELTTLFDQGAAQFGTPEEQHFIDEHFAQCPNISIDYGVMEKAQRRYTIPADFGWSDIGTWGSLFVHAAKDDHNNALRGKVIVEDTRNSVVNVEAGVEAIVEGLDGCLVAYRDNSLLVCRLQDEQHIKEWVEKL